MKGKSRMFDWSWRWTLLAAMCLLVRPSIAYAHLVSTGFGPFYDGIMHLVLSPDNLLGVLAIALLSGLVGARHGRAVLFTLSSGFNPSWSPGSTAIEPPPWLPSTLLGRRCCAAGTRRVNVAGMVLSIDSASLTSTP